jgi:hypothetical protein
MAVQPSLESTIRQSMSFAIVRLLHALFVVNRLGDRRARRVHVS